ncbi:hypothetical protein GCM10011414_15370 [Croceivirga lutea]|uniref:acyl-CoA thioesterase n=1 Tax=Croceivirga lutea TaxID=1775167 RepID=UPI00163ABC0F|nr:acyl-CoA thioesterase [Croceivirga lutea]GGG46645.1 hypothetical protein GCM10011414_15370 [Croceivirga lutea]
MRLFTQTVLVTIEHLDENKHVNNVQFLTWIQEISRAHWSTIAPKEVVDNYVWVVRNHNITYHKSAFLDDKLKLVTQISKWKGPLCWRKVEIIDSKSNNILVSALTEWCMLERKSMKPKRIHEHLIELFS